MKLAVGVILFLCLIGCALAETVVDRCPEGKTPQELKQTVTIGNCQNPPCRLKKKSVVNAEFKFTPDRNVKKITNSVHAKIIGLPFPFIGVDSTDACSQVYESDGTTKATCPLKAGTEYVYKNKFDILELYPKLKLVVHWGLTTETGHDVMCFEVPAKITS